MTRPMTLRSRTVRRSARTRPHVPDPCPLCTADLGGSGGTTRRVIVWTPEPGVFVWRCPDCSGAWTEDDGRAPGGSPAA